MRIIFNADDFGLSKGVNFGVIEAYQNGLVRSTTMMAGTPGFEHAVGLAKQNPGLHIGVHLTLTAVKSVGGVYKTITDTQGVFWRLGDMEEKAAAGNIDLAEVEAEFEAQIQKVLAAGIAPDHFDSHHHVHNLPGIGTVYLKLAKKYGVGVRNYNKSLLGGACADVKTSADFSDAFYNERTTVDDLKTILSSCNGASLEIMTHPSYVDYTLYNCSSYHLKRIFELHVLTSDAIKDFVKEKGFEVCSFSDL